MKTVTLYRQGDVNLLKINSLPAGVEPVEPDKGRVILAYGEVTGHAHALPLKAAKQFRAGSGGNRYVEITAKSAELRHEEHAPVKLEQGVYQVIMAREYIPGGERQVID